MYLWWMYDTTLYFHGHGALPLTWNTVTVLVLPFVIEGNGKCFSSFEVNLGDGRIHRDDELEIVSQHDIWIWIWWVFWVFSCSCQLPLPAMIAYCTYYSVDRYHHCGLPL